MKVKYFLVILIPLLIIFLNFQFIIFSNGNSTAVNENVLNYFKNRGDLKFNFTMEETVHLKDVKSLINTLNITTAVLAIITAIILILNKETISKQLILAGIISAGIVLILAVIDYSTLFTLFHKTLFTNNYWILPKESLLIKTYPSDFFTNASKRLALNIIITSFVSTGLGIIQNVHTRHKSSAD